jgi:HK97 family phage major capsid protein
MSDVVKIDPAQVGAAIKSEIVAELTPAIEAQIKAALKLLEQDPRFMRQGYVTPDGGTADAEVKTFGDFLVSIVRGDEKRLRDHYKAVSLAELERGEKGQKALNETAGASGGWTVPPEMNTRLLEVAGEASAIDRLTGNRRPMDLPMSARELTLPVLDYSQAPSAGGSALDAGVYARWTEEAGTIQETEPRFRTMTLRARKLAGYTVASAELEADSAVALERLLTRLFGQAIGRRRAHAFLRGDGVGKPLGVLNSAAKIAVSRAGGGNTVDTADVLGMLERILPSSEGNAVWIAHPFLKAELAALTIGSSNVLAWGDIRTGLPATLLGMPILFDEFMPAPGVAGDILLADFSYYLIGNRATTAIAMSEHARFTTDEKVWRFTHRVDGQPWIDSAITLGDGAGTNTVSPFVTLTAA